MQDAQISIPNDIDEILLTNYKAKRYYYMKLPKQSEMTAELLAVLLQQEWRLEGRFTTYPMIIRSRHDRYHHNWILEQKR